MHHLRAELMDRAGIWLESVQACSAAYTLQLRRPRLDGAFAGPCSPARALPATSNTSPLPACPYIHTCSSFLFLEKFIFLETFLYSHGIYWRNGWMIWRADIGGCFSVFYDKLSIKFSSFMDFISDGTLGGCFSPCETVKVLAVQSCLIVCDPMDHSPPGSSVHGFSRQESWSG